MSESGPRVSPTSLGVYAQCPRQYEYDKVWEVETPEDSRRYLDRGIAYHTAIEDVCDAVAEADDTVSDSWIQRTAKAAIEERWEERAERQEYHSAAQYQYDRQLTISAIKSYFEEDGLEHARKSVAQEVWLECERGDVQLVGRADNVVRTQNGLQVIDYKGSLNGIVSGRSHEKIEAHAAGEDYAGDILSSVFQAAMYLEGIKQSQYYESGMDVEFTFYGLLASKDRKPHLDGIQVKASGRSRDVGWIYEAHESTIWELIDEAYHGIIGLEYEPEPWDRIQEHVCEDCPYQAMCGEYIADEVKADD